MPNKGRSAAELKKLRRKYHLGEFKKRQGVKTVAGQRFVVTKLRHPCGKKRDAGVLPKKKRPVIARRAAPRNWW